MKKFIISALGICGAVMIFLAVGSLEADTISFKMFFRLEGIGILAIAISYILSKLSGYHEFN